MVKLQKLNNGESVYEGYETVNLHPGCIEIAVERDSNREK